MGDVVDAAEFARRRHAKAAAPRAKRSIVDPIVSYRDGDQPPRAILPKRVPGANTPPRQGDDADH